MKLLTSETSTRAVVAGYDIAGRENDDDIPGDLMKRFIDMNLEFGLKTTFHAGEQADASNLRSAYQIHTERVGHALRLIEYPVYLMHTLNQTFVSKCVQLQTLKCMDTEHHPVSTTTSMESTPFIL